MHWLLVYFSSSTSHPLHLPTRPLLPNHLSSTLPLSSFPSSPSSSPSSKPIPSRVQGVHLRADILQLCPPCSCHHGAPHPRDSHGAAHRKCIPHQRAACACHCGATATPLGGSGCGVLLQGSLVRVLCGHIQHSLCHVCSGGQPSQKALGVHLGILQSIMVGLPVANSHPL